MDFFKFVGISSLLLFFAFHSSKAEVGFQIAGSNENRTDFYILETSSDFLITNLFREETDNPGNLQLSLSGVKINKFDQYLPNKGKWNMKLSDGSDLDFTLEDSLSATSYKIWWHGKGGPRELCVHYGKHNASWYNSYQSHTPHWPMDTSKNLSLEAFNNLGNFSSDESKEDFYLILEHIFINTDGFAVFVDDLQPVFLRRDSNHGDPLLCFSANNAAPYLNKTDDRFYKDLTIHLFASTDIRHVLEYVLQYSELIPKPHRQIPDEKEFTYPTWSDVAVGASPVITQKDILKLAADIEKHGFSNQSEILIDDSLQQDHGDLGFDKKNFPDPKQMIETLHSKGFRIGLGIKPLIQKAPNHTADFFIKDARSHKPTNLVDFSNVEACTWYEYMLRKLHFDFGVDGFQLSSFPIHENLVFKDPEIQKYPGLLSKKYIETVARLGNKVVSEVGYRTQNLPIFVKFTQAKGAKFEHLLESLIPNALALSIGGYSNFIPYQIGGFNRETKPSPELYIRWVQALTFMPSMSFLHTPWSYNNDTIVKLTKKFVDLHATHAPTFIRLAKNRATVGWPVIRPMWYLDPNDAETYHINDQFMVGDDLLVAPVLKEGQRERSVYLPKGIWIDQHGREFIGTVRIQVKAPLEELIYFKRGREH